MASLNRPVVKGHVLALLEEGSTEDRRAGGTPEDESVTPGRFLLLKLKERGSNGHHATRSTIKVEKAR